jgi:hypothetical protein
VHGGSRFRETRFRASALERVTRARTSVVTRSAVYSAASDLASGEDPSDQATNQKKNESRTKLMFLPRHDFCVTLPWGLFVALCGLAGFVIAGSAKSLVFGGGFGGLLMILGALSLKKWKAGKNGAPETVVSFGITAALGAMMGKKYFLNGGSLVPSGVIAVGAGCMCLFYLSNLLRGGNPARVAAEEGATQGGSKKKE